LLRRVGRIISGSVNAMVDAIENAAPETVMEQAIREIDSATDEVRAELGRLVANKHLANKQLMEENRKHEDFTAKIALAVEQGRDDLAEAAIARQLDIEAQIPVLEHTISDCRTQEQELEGYIAALQAKRREMKAELRQFRERNREAAVVADSGGDTVDPGGKDVEGKVARAESAFERVFEKATGLSTASGDGDRQNATRLAELAELSRRNKIMERLAAVKKDRENK